MRHTRCRRASRAQPQHLQRVPPELVALTAELAALGGDDARASFPFPGAVPGVCCQCYSRGHQHIIVTNTSAAVDTAADGV